MRSARRKTIGIDAGVSWCGDRSASRRRYRRAQTAAGVRPLCWHDLRRTYRSLLAANGLDLVTIQAVGGHSALVIGGRYLHTRPASSYRGSSRKCRAPWPPGGSDGLS